MTAPGGWLELEEAPLFTRDGRRFTMALSANGYKQVNVINRDTNQRVPITSGRMVVTNIYHWDEVNHEIYFKATKEDSPGERHLYKVTDFQVGRKYFDEIFLQYFSNEIFSVGPARPGDLSQLRRAQHPGRILRLQQLRVLQRQVLLRHVL